MREEGQPHPLFANCPQAASISLPRLRRTVTVTPFPGQISRKFIQAVFVRFFKNDTLDRVVFDDVDPHREFAAAELHEFGGVIEDCR
jgi:hypothetical protein